MTGFYARLAMMVAIVLVASTVTHFHTHTQAQRDVVRITPKVIAETRFEVEVEEYMPGFHDFVIRRPRDFDNTERTNRGFTTVNDGDNRLFQRYAEVSTSEKHEWFEFSVSRSILGTVAFFWIISDEEQKKQWRYRFDAKGFAGEAEQ